MIRINTTHASGFEGIGTIDLLEQTAHMPKGSLVDVTYDHLGQLVTTGGKVVHCNKRSGEYFEHRVEYEDILYRAITAEKRDSLVEFRQSHPRNN